MKQKMLQAVFLVVIAVGPTWAIGPYFENESNQGQGPRAEIPKPLARVPDSRIATTFVKGEVRRAEEGLYADEQKRAGIPHRKACPNASLRAKGLRFAFEGPFVSNHVPRLFFGDRRSDQRNHPRPGAAVLDDPKKLAVRPGLMELGVREIPG